AVSSGGVQTASAACSDSAGNAYTTDVSQNGGLFSLTIICSTHELAAPLPLSSSVTVTWSGASGTPEDVRMHAFAVTGLASAPLDQPASAAGFGNSPSSGATATTTQANELLFGVVMPENLQVSSAGFNPGPNGTANTCAASGTTTYASLSDVGSSPPALFGI